MTESRPDLYAVLGVRRGASAVDLRRAYDWCLSTRQPPERRTAVQDAYSVLGDPRLRSEYDRGRVVGVGMGRLHQSPSAASADARRASSPGRQADRQERPWQQGRSCEASGSATPVPKAVTFVLAGLTLACLVAVLMGELQFGPATAGRGSATAAVPPAAPVAALPRPPATGACFSPDGSQELRPQEPVSCDIPHLFESIKNVDLARLSGQAVTQAGADAAAADVCLSEFSSFTGLSEPAADLWSTSVLTTGGGAAQLTCLVASRSVRTGTAAGVAD